jgi:SAM-dependent methyltransferase
MKFTGERYIPGAVPPDLAPRIHFEHVHRYALAAEMVSGRVLDLASGAGYGTRLLSSRAERVVGLDIDLTAGQFATRQYSTPGRVDFVVGDACSLPFSSATFDWVICFEAIEHVATGSSLVAEAARVLKTNGTLMLSSPIASEHKRTYPDHENPFHVHEYESGELSTLLSPYFRRVDLLGQRLVFGSAIWPSTDPRGELLRVLPAPQGDELAFKNVPLFAIALCTNSLSRRDLTTTLLAGRLEGLLDGLVSTICARYESEISRRDHEASIALAEAKLESARLTRLLSEARASRFGRLRNRLHRLRHWFDT